MDAVRTLSGPLTLNFIKPFHCATVKPRTSTGKGSRTLVTWVANQADFVAELHTYAYNGISVTYVSDCYLICR